MTAMSPLGLALPSERHSSEAELAEFAHLHLHTEYSLLDGMGRTAEYAARAKDWASTTLR